MPIGLFQFENLIFTHVPFILFAWNFDFAGWFKGLEQMHLQQVLRRGDQLLMLLPELQRDLNQPIVLVCENGLESKAQAEKLEAMGFKNVFYVIGGWKKMSEERATR